MTFTESISFGLSKYFAFSGRASRSEYWWFVLFWVVISMASFQLGMMLNHPAIGFSVCSGIGFATVTAGVRRLHDINKSGYHVLWIIGVPFLALMIHNNTQKLSLSEDTVSLIVKIMFIGVGIAWIALMTQKGDIGDNEYGYDPLEIN